MTISVNPVQDNTIYATGDTSAGAYISLFAGETSTFAPRRALMKFDLSSIPAGSTINSATLTLNVNTVGGMDATTRAYSVFRLTRDWGEGTSAGLSGTGGGGAGNGSDATTNSSTWNFSLVSTVTGSPATVTSGTHWTTAGGDFLPTASAMQNVPGGTFTGLVNWSSSGLVSDVQSWINGTAGNFGWILEGDEGTLVTDKGANRIFDSRESATPALRPTLSVDFTAVPEPSTFVMLATGGIILAGWRGIRRKLN